MNRFSRREFLGQASAATLAALSMNAASSHAAAAPKPRADRMILLWMGGAMGQTETFDPKRYFPFEKGMETKKLLSSFPTIDTCVDHIKFCQGVENLAQVIDRGSVLRSYVARDYGAQAEDLQHIPLQFKFHTGYTLPSTVAPPFLGAVISRLRGPLNPDIPPYIEIGRSEKTANVFLALAAFSTAGFLGAEHGSLMIPEATRAADILRTRIDAGRFDDRYRRFKELVAASPVGELGSSHQKESLLRSLDSAYRLLKSPAAKALDLGQEKKEVYQTYDTGPFGRGCLLARRLVEAGARFVEVHVDFENAKGWDTHSDGHRGQAKMKKVIDAPVARLILDLEERGLLDSTLVVLATEFGRATIGRGGTKVKTIDTINNYGLHGHFGAAASFLLFGGGIKKANVHGRTDDEYPCATVENPVPIQDLHATLYHLMGISPKHSFEVERRPFYVTKDGLGKPVTGLIA
ncbi:MAG: DUF1501 domain-containing protein [Gemmataceae bacterium]